MEYAAIFGAGIIVGTAIVLIINHFRQKDMENAFSALSSAALRNNRDDFISMAKQALSEQTQAGVGALDEKKKLIDQTLDGIKSELSKVARSVTDFDGKREKSFGELTTQLKNTAEQTNKLQGTTSTLQSMLANTRIRGQWGERIAEDILQLLGFVENLDYKKQQTQDISKSRPDFTFLLPFERKVNMDSKFPFENYQNYVQAESEVDKENYKKKFISSVRDKVKEITSREYINVEEDTVDYAIMFVPNEQVFCFLHESDPNIFDYALKEKVILCSPITLFSILCVIREAVKIFKLQKTTGDIVKLLSAFHKQWNEFKKSMDKMGDKISQAYDEFGKLKTTRSKKLEVPLRGIAELQRQGEFIETVTVEEPLELESDMDNLEE